MVHAVVSKTFVANLLSAGFDLTEYFTAEVIHVGEHILCNNKQDVWCMQWCWKTFVVILLSAVFELAE